MGVPIPEKILIPVQLNERQRKTAATRGYVNLTRAQALRVRGLLTAAGGAGRPSYGKPMCGCGCGLTLDRARLRHPGKAVLLVPAQEKEQDGETAP